jgi:hypothetical protein
LGGEKERNGKISCEFSGATPNFRGRAAGRLAIPRFDPGFLLNLCRLHKTKKHTVDHFFLQCLFDDECAGVVFLGGVGAVSREQ